MVEAQWWWWQEKDTGTVVVLLRGAKSCCFGCLTQCGAGAKGSGTVPTRYMRLELRKLKAENEDVSPHSQFSNGDLLPQCISVAQWLIALLTEFTKVLAERIEAQPPSKAPGALHRSSQLRL